MIAEEIISEIRSRADIVAVIGQHVQLKKAGRSWKGLCPFHGEKTPSFNVMPDKGFFHCFGCQQSGDVFKFVMLMEGKGFVEAAEQLGARFGVAVPKIDESPELKRARGERVAMLDVNRVAAQFFREILADAKRGEAGRAYLAKRGVDAATTDKFQLGYGPADWHALADYLKAKRADLELAAKLGLVAKQPRAGGYYDRYRDRLVCPVVVPGGEIVGFSARVVSAQKAPDGSEPPKYINSPESAVYKKSKLLFGLAQAREGMQQNGRAVLVEGNFDVITLHQAGFHDVVAPLGTALTVDQVQTLKRLAGRVVLVYDGDRAGYKATMHALQTCVEAEVEVAVASRPGNAKSGGAGLLAGGVDPDSLVAGGGAEQLRQAIDRAQGGIEFFAFEVWSKARGNAGARARALGDAAPLLAKIGNPAQREMLVNNLAEALGIDAATVRGGIARSTERAAPKAHAEDEKLEPVELQVVALLAEHAELITSPEADKAFSLLTAPRLRAIYTAARAGQPVHELVMSLPKSAYELAMRRRRYADMKNPRAELAELVQNLELRKQKLELVERQQRIVEAQRRGDHELARKIATENVNRKQAE
ncbi:MAG TPA: DNA primase [Kofleriaceae bacterium]|nr:DNA primase [Kofleriaceae bacterium]